MKTQVFYSETCPTCCRAPGAPFRAYDAQGSITAGCVDEFHTSHLVVPSASASWHARPVSKKIRATIKAGRLGGVTHYARNAA